MTTRPETIYGVTNLWVDKNYKYEIFEVITNHDKSYWICQEFNLLSLKNQTRCTDEYYIKEYTKINDIKGNDLVKLSVIHPLNFIESKSKSDSQYNNTIIVAPLNFQNIDQSLKINTNKGTGIIMSVPSDSPIDYLGCLYTNNQGNIKINAPIKPIIKCTHADYTGNLMAIDMINRVKTEKNNVITVNNIDMNIIKEFCYIGSINNSIMLTGDYSGHIVTEARNYISTDKKFNRIIIKYYEPDQEAYSRMGDKLIVAKMDQWYIDYGNPDWKILALNHLESMNFTDSVVKNGLNIAINWLDKWPCSRTYGLGSNFPEEIV